MDKVFYDKMVVKRGLSGKYAKLAILASLVEPKSLSEIGLFWYNENGRFYKKKPKQEIKQAVEKEFLLRDRTKYKANTEKIISCVCSSIKDNDLKELLIRFWNHPFSQQTYLCCEAIKHMFNNNPEKIAESNPFTILNMPLILHMLQEKNPEVYSLFISLQDLESYTNIINIKSEKNMSKAFKNLKEKTDWLATLNKIVKNDGYLLKQNNSELKIKEIMKKIKK